MGCIWSYFDSSLSVEAVCLRVQDLKNVKEAARAFENESVKEFNNFLQQKSLSCNYIIRRGEVVNVSIQHHASNLSIDEHLVLKTKKESNKYLAGVAEGLENLREIGISATQKKSLEGILRNLTLRIA